MKVFLQKVSLVLGSILLCFVLLEALFKIIALIQPNQAAASSIPGLPYENTPNARFWRLDREAGLNFYSHNSFGLRGPNISMEKPKGTFRVALLGDSVVYGGNVSQRRTTADFLEKFLQASKPSAYEAVQVLNFGVAGFGIKEYAMLLEKKAFLFQPDIIVVGLCLNDYYVRDEKSFTNEKKDSGQNWWRERFANLTRSHFLEFVANATGVRKLSDFLPNRRAIIDGESLKDLESTLFLNEEEKSIVKDYCQRSQIPLKFYMEGIIRYIGEYRDEASWSGVSGDFSRIIELGRSRGIPVYFFCYPSSEQILPGYKNVMPQAFIRTLAEGLGGRCIEVLDGFRRYSSAHPAERIFPRYDNLHMAANGHKLSARLVADRLIADHFGRS